MGIDQSGTRATPRLDLGAAIMEFIDNAKDFIGARVFPVFKTQEKAATYSAITRESLTQTADTKRSKRGTYNRASIGAKDKTFSCVENGIEVPLDDSERAMYATDFDAELVASKIATRIVLTNQEIRIAAKLFDTSEFTGAALYTSYASAPWTTAASDALAQLKAARSKVRSNCGMKANAAVMSDTNLERLKALTVVKEAVKYTSRTTDAELENALADLIGVKYLIVAGSIKNSAKEGQAFSSADIWGSDYVSVCVVADNAQDLSQPSIGRTFLWAKDCPENVFVEQYRGEDARSDIFRSRQHTDEVLVDKYFGHLIKVTA